MKKIFFLIIAVLVSTFAFSQNVISLFNKSNQFFTLLDQNKFTEAYGFIDESVKPKISEDNLKNLWANINTNLGKINSLEAVRSKIEGEYYAVTIEGKFEKDDQNFVLVFNKAEKVVGILMPPKQNTTAYKVPSYADTTLYKETSTYLVTPGHQLATIITTPKNIKNFPIVVLVHGSGPGDMDETVGPNKPFKDLALGLAAKGIATIRYVKRTLVYAHEFGKVFTVKEEVLDDATAAVAMAKTVQGINPQAIYLLGHSLGGMMAPKLATLNPNLAGIILAAAPARKFTDLIIDQNKYSFEQAKDTTEGGKKQLADALVEIEKSRITTAGNMKADSLILGLPVSYWVDLNNYDQVAVAKKLSKPRILVLQGGNDFQVSEVDYKIWNTGLAKKQNVSFKFYPDLNHLLSPQTEKGNASQYQKQTNVSETLVNHVANWIKDKR